LKYLCVIALSVLAVVTAISFVMRLGDSDVPGATQECGWDLTESEGIQAHNIYVTQTAQWLGNRDPSSLEQPPPPDTPYWRGNCPIDPDIDVEPPIHEDDH